MEIKTLFENPWVSVRQKGRWIYSHFTKSNSETIGILPYRVTDTGLEVGVIQEDIPCHNTTSVYLITGAIEEGNTSEETAVIELLEEAGIVADKEDPMFMEMGEFYPLKHSDCRVATYIVDVTGKKCSVPKGDGSEHEKESTFSFIKGEDLLALTNDPNLIATYYLLLDICAEVFGSGDTK